ncbi:hypothetical protein CMV_013057 [Castanea mollissima]|uniref:CBS domain-containing protein n=1 Tax=Castanea mollissima TaxID=60419 RepID=A0A8J4R2C5_9ROSI|nr:hypothetical protein CMV_013057 [Castanea mollissima]
MKSELSLDLFMRLERGLDGNWAIVWSEVNEVGPNSLKPSKPIIHNLIPSSPIVPTKPRRVWRPCQTPITLNPAHCQISNPYLIAHALGSRLQMPMEVQVPRVGQVGSSSRGEEARSVTARGDDPVTGKDGEASCSADKAIIDAGKDPSGFSSPDTEMPDRLGIWDLGVIGDLMVGSDLVRNGPVMRNGLFPSVDLGNVLEAGPNDCLKDVALKILQNKVATVPIIHFSSQDGSVPQLLHLASLSGILKCIYRYFRHSSSSLPILQQPICSIPCGTWVPKIGDSKPFAMLRPNASLSTALALLVQAGVSSIPIVDDNGSLLDIYSRSDITALAKDKVYAQIHLDEMSILEALRLGQDANSPHGVFNGQRCQMCLRSDPLHEVMKRLANPGVRRLIIVEAGSNRVEAGTAAMFVSSANRK